MALLEPLQTLISRLRREKREQHKRHVSIGDLFTDRWEIARDYGFGEGTSCYDNVLILGDVKVGKNCWIGATRDFTVPAGHYQSAITSTSVLASTSTPITPCSEHYREAPRQ